MAEGDHSPLPRNANELESNRSAGPVLSAATVRASRRRGAGRRWPARRAAADVQFHGGSVGLSAEVLCPRERNVIADGTDAAGDVYLFGPQPVHADRG